MSYFLKTVIAAFYPHRCAFCGKLVEYPKQCCDSCFNSLPIINGEICEICGHPKELCSSHIADIKYERIVSGLIYNSTVRAGIKSFKFNGNKASGEFFANLLYNTIKKHYSDIKFDCITYVPMTKKQIKARGYNQAEIIARYISLYLCVPIKSDLLTRAGSVLQHNLRLSGRNQNAVSSYICNGSNATGLTILLIDDIITTSHTVNECSRQLKNKGAKKVYCASIATALKYRSV